MFFIWGKNSLSEDIYHLLCADDQKNVTFIETNPRMDGEVYENSVLTLPEKVKVEEVEKVIIPAYGSLLEKNIMKSLKELGCELDKVWIMSLDCMKAEIEECENLRAIVEKGTTPFLHYLEFEVTHHCNLKCKACSHFSPLSEEKFGSLDEYVRDLTQLSKFVDTFEEIRLMGGEPLLNDELYRFVEETRKIYPISTISVVTNGLKLAGIDERLKETMRKTNSQFSISLYPPVKSFIGSVAQDLNGEGVKCICGFEADTFAAQLRLEGDSDPANAEEFCWEANCPTIEDGRISKCSFGMKVPVLKRHFNLDADFPDDTLDLFDENLTSQKLFEFLVSPEPLCRFCGKKRTFDWEKAGKNPPLEDWLGDGRI